MPRGKVQKRRLYIAPSSSSSDGVENVTVVARPLKQPTRTFIRFKNDYVKEQKSKYGDRHYQDMVKEACQFWKQMSDKEKEPYEAAYLEERKIYLEERKIYMQHGTFTSKKKEVCHFHRSGLSKFIQVISQFDEKKRKAVQQIGFGNLLELKCSYLNRDLCLYLIARFDCSSHRLRVGDEKSILISALDIKSILGIPCTQLPVPRGIPSGASWIEDGGFCQKNGLKVTTLADKLLKLDAGDEFKRAFVLFTCGAILSPNGRYEAYKNLLKAVDKVEQIRTYNWCSYVFNHLLISIKNFSGGSQIFTGCLIFLQFLYVMRVDVKWPSPKGDVQSIGVWTDELIKARIRFEKEEIGGFGCCERVDILSRATRDIPISKKITSEHTLETRVSTSPAASLMCPSQLENTTSTGTSRLAKRRKEIDHINKVVSDNHRPIREANEASNIVGSKPEGSANNGNQREEHLGRTFSLNLTEMAEISYDHSCDFNEVGSPLDSALVTVNKYGVKPEWVPLLKSIFLKHGDIAKDCSVVSIRSRSSFLEMICEIIQKLQDTEFIHIMPEDLKSILDQVRDLEVVKMEVGWLHRRLSRGYSTLKEEWRTKVQVIKKKEEELNSFKTEIIALKEKVLLAEDELTPMKAEAEKIAETVSEIKARVKCF